MTFTRKASLFTLFATIFFCGCENRVEYDPEEILVTIDTGNWLTGTQGFVIIENRESGAIFSELTKGQECILKRGEKIKGDHYNLHLLNIIKTPDDEVISWKLYSFLEVLPGQDVDLYYVFNPGTTILEKVNWVGNIIFTEVPSFDIVTRSANNPRHCHTLNTLVVPCALPGNDMYFSGNYFYTCLQQGDDAGYKLVYIPDESFDEYEISLSDLNDDMTMHLITADPSQVYIDIMAYGSSGSLEIFALHDETVFPDDNIKVFVPDGIPQMTSFSTTYNKPAVSGHGQTSIYRNSTVTTDFSFLEAGLKLNHISGSMPSIIHNNTGFSQLNTNLIFTGHIGSWSIVHPNASSLYRPELPAEVLGAISSGFILEDQLSNVINVSVTAIDDSRCQDYYDAIDLTLDPESTLADSYSRLSDVVQFSHN